MTLGDKISKLRSEHYLSQGELAEKMGVSRQSISKWETGVSVPDLDKLVALSELFSISLDALVKDKETSENAKTQEIPPVPSEAPAKFPPRKIVGYILLGVGLLSVILGLALNILLAFLGAYFILCSIICLTVKRHPVLVIGWGTFLSCAYFLPWFTSVNMRMIFHPYIYRDISGWTGQLIISYGFWAALFLLIFVTVKRTRAKKHPFLFCGWAVFSQVYGFIPIAFRHTEQTMNSYIVLSWCVILLALVLLFLTGKILHSYRKTSEDGK